MTETLATLIQEGGALFPEYRSDYATRLVARIREYPEDTNGYVVALEMQRTMALDLAKKLTLEATKRRIRVDFSVFMDGFATYAGIISYTYVAAEGGLDGTYDMLRQLKRQVSDTERRRLAIAEGYLTQTTPLLRRDPTGFTLAQQILVSEAQAQPNQDFCAGLQAGFFYWCFWREALEGLGYDRV